MSADQTIADAGGIAARGTLRKRTFSGLRWSAASQVAQQAARFGFSIVLARILTPREFGLVAMLAVFTGFARLFTSAGFGASIIQKQDIRSDHLDTVFWVNVATGFILAGLFGAAGPAIARFYGEPILSSLAWVVALTFAVNSLNVVQSSLLQKEMNFRQLFWIDVGAMFCGGVAAVLIALKGFGVWGLIIQDLVVAGVSVAVMWCSARWRPRFHFHYDSLRELFGFSGNLMAFNAVNYWTRNFDTLLVGKVLGGATAGIYNRAYQLMLLPISQVTAVVTRVMFPALAAIQHDLPRVRSVYLRSTRIISFVTFPLMFLLMVLARPVILTMYGQKWEDAVPIFQVLCLAAVVQAVGVTVSWIYNSQGRTDLQLKWGLIATPIRIAAFIVGIHWGVMGMTVAYVLSGYLLILYPSWTIPGRLIGLRFSAMVLNLAPTFYAALAASLVVGVIDHFWLQGAAQAWRLAIGLAIGTAAYLAPLRLLRTRAWTEMIQLAHEACSPSGRR